MNRAHGKDLLELIEAARAGDDAAYARILNSWNEPLIGLMRRLTGWSSDAARDVAFLIWSKQREFILRPAADGGYTDGPMPPASRSRLFHTYVLMDCTDWGRVLARHAEIAPGIAAELPEQIDTITPSPVESLEKRAACEALFSLVCSPRTGYPHQQLTFIFSKYMFGRGSNGNQGDALRTDAECGPVPMRELFRRLERELFWLDDRGPASGNGVIGRAFVQLHRRLSLTVEEMFAEAKDTQAARRHAPLLGKVVGDTCLRDYYPPHPEDDRKERQAHTQNLIADWCRKVAVKLRGQLGLSTG